MNRIKTWLLILLASWTAGAAAEDAWSKEQQAAFGQSVTDFARSAGLLGYLYGMPLFEFSVAELRQTRGIAKDNSAPHGQFGYFNGGHLSDHTTTWFAVPNPDVLYASAWLYLKGQPYVIHVPPMDDIWYSVQFENYFSVDEAYLSTRTIGQKGGDFLITDQEWQPPLPPGLAGHVRISTPRVWILTRIAATRDNEKERHLRYERRFQLLPLADYLKSPATAWDRPSPTQANLPTLPEADYAMRETLDFFRIVNHHLRQTDIPAADQGLMAMFDAAGFGPRVVFDPAKLTPQVRAGLEQAVKEGYRYVDTMRAAPMSNDGSGWSVAPRGLGTFGQNYIMRALSVYGGLGANIPEEAIYPNAYSDSQGRLLTGDHDYTITFPAGQTPPGIAFWSITLMDVKTRFMVDNPIHRNHVGSTTKGLQTNADGSLTIYLSAKEPKDPVHRANWLPSLPGIGIQLVMRIYQPTEAALAGAYKPPAVLRVE